MKRILIMGLPGSGKTTLATVLAKTLNASHFNADAVRAQFNDWDFSPEGRIRQGRRMRELCDSSSSIYAIADFVCPLPEMRDIFNADYTIWMDTISSGRFEDTNQIFVPPTTYDFCIKNFEDQTVADRLANNIKNSL